MSGTLALLLAAIGIAGLFFLDRDKSVRTSWALWLPVFWVCIVGSRPVSVWLGITPPNLPASEMAEGSPVDRLVFQIILALGIVVLLVRKRRPISLLRANLLILTYFGYCLLAVLWSDFPDVAFKRWIKAIGDLVMVLIVATGAEPVEALRRLVTRSGFVLLPLSAVLIRYFGNLGRGYDPDGLPMNTGVTTNKNTLGLITFVLSLGAVWNVWRFLRARGQAGRWRHLLAHGIVLAFGVAVLIMADSATSLFCFIVGASLITASQLSIVRRSPGRIHAVVGLMALFGTIVLIFGGRGAFTHALGRQESFTGRTEIWSAVIGAVPNPIIGAGFESFWLGSRLEEVWNGLSQYMHVNEAHNGYIEVYLNLGLIGLVLIVLLLVNAYRRACATYYRDSTLGGLMLAYVATAALYSITEAGFRMLSPMWIFFLIAEIGCLWSPRKRAVQPPAAPSDRVIPIPPAIRA